MKRSPGEHADPAQSAAHRLATSFSLHIYIALRLRYRSSISARRLHVSLVITKDCVTSGFGSCDGSRHTFSGQFSFVARVIKCGNIMYRINYDPWR